MLNTIEIDLLQTSLYHAYLDDMVTDKEYRAIIDKLVDMSIDARYTEECHRENEREALEASATYNCLGLPQWCGKCHVCKAYGVKVAGAE